MLILTIMKTKKNQQLRLDYVSDPLVHWIVYIAFPEASLACVWICVSMSRHMKTITTIDLAIHLLTKQHY